MKLSATRRALLVGVVFATGFATGAFAADKPAMGVVVKIFSGGTRGSITLRRWASRNRARRTASAQFS